MTTTALIISEKFYSEWNSTTGASFYNIVSGGSTFTYYTTPLPPYILFSPPSRYRYRLNYDTQIKPYIDRGDFSVNNFALVDIPTTNFNGSTIISELWIINADSSMLNTTDFVRKKIIDMVPSLAYVWFYIPLSPEVFSVYGSTWKNTLVTNMVTSIYA